MLDKHFSDKVWFSDIHRVARSKYKVAKDPRSKETFIKSRIGELKTYSIINKKLFFMLNAGHSKIKNKLLQNPLLSCSAEGDTEAIFVFDEANLDALADELQLKRRKVLSEETKIKMQDNLARAREAKKELNGKYELNRNRDEVLIDATISE